jgi:dynactin 1
LVINVMSQLHGLPSSLHSATSEALVGACELRGKLRHFSTLNRRFAAIMGRAGPDEWVAYGKVLAEVGGVENKVDGWIGMIKTDEFSEGDCARELGRCVQLTTSCEQ